jgi:hypothetical protein
MNSLDLTTWCLYLRRAYPGKSNIEIDIRNLAEIAIALDMDRRFARESYMEDMALSGDIIWTDNKPEIEDGGTF